MGMFELLLATAPREHAHHDEVWHERYPYRSPHEPQSPLYRVWVRSQEYCKFIDEAPSITVAVDLNRDQAERLYAAIAEMQRLYRRWLKHYRWPGCNLPLPLFYAPELDHLPFEEWLVAIGR